MSYDDNGYKYDIPIFVINEPSDYKIPDESNKEFDQKTQDIKIRSGKQDVDLSLNTNMLVSEVIDLFKKQGKKEDSEIRLQFGGKQMKPENKLGVYCSTNCVIQCFISKKLSTMVPPPEDSVTNPGEAKSGEVKKEE